MPDAASFDYDHAPPAHLGVLVERMLTDEPPAAEEAGHCLTAMLWSGWGDPCPHCGGYGAAWGHYRDEEGMCRCAHCWGWGIVRPRAGRVTPDPLIARWAEAAWDTVEARWGPDAPADVARWQAEQAAARSRAARRAYLADGP